MSLDSSATPRKFTFSSPEGRALCKKILAESTPWPHEPHDFQLEGACKALDGIDVLAVTPTGSGKSGLLIIYMLLYSAIANDPALCPATQLKVKNPAMVFVCPTKALQYDMEPKFRANHLATVVINSDTVEASQRANREGKKSLWKQVTTANVIILAAEQLKTKEYEAALNDPAFTSRVVAFGVDEVHLLGTWGAEFRPVLRQIGNIRVRMPGSPILIGLTATLQCGTPTKAVCSFLNLHEGTFHLIRLSNARHDVRIIVRHMQSGLRSLRFPELDWVLESERKIIIFCTTISFGFRLTCYLWHRARKLPGRSDRIRMYNSLNATAYNAHTLDFMHNDCRSRVTIATDTLSVGIDAANTDDVILIGDTPGNTDDILQKGGRIRDGRGRDSRLIIYLPKSAVANADIALGLKEAKQSRAKANPKAKQAGSVKTTEMDVSVARFITAPCKVSIIDELYDNPIDTLPCHCVTCTLNPPTPRADPCNCSECAPEPVPQQAQAAAQPKPKPVGRSFCSPKVTKAMRRYGVRRLVLFRTWLWDCMADDLRFGFTNSDDFLPDTVIAHFFDSFRSIQSQEDIPLAVLEHHLVADYHEQLFVIVLELRAKFTEMHRITLAERKLVAIFKEKSKLSVLLKPTGRLKKPTHARKGLSKITIKIPARPPAVKAPPAANSLPALTIKIPGRQKLSDTPGIARASS